MDEPSKVGDDHVVTLVPGPILAQVDARVGVDYIDRADFIVTAVRYYLEYLRAEGNNGTQQSLPS